MVKGFCPQVSFKHIRKKFFQVLLEKSTGVLPEFASEHPPGVPSEINLKIYSIIPPVTLSAMSVKSHRFLFQGRKKFLQGSIQKFRKDLLWKSLQSLRVKAMNRQSENSGFDSRSVQ